MADRSPSHLPGEPADPGRNDWLDGVVVLNESANERIPGKVSIHRSDADALRVLTPWPVHQGTVFAFSAAGTRLALSPDDSGDFTLIGRVGCEQGPAIVREWLEALANTTQDKRRADALKGRVNLSTAEESGMVPASIEGLLAYIGLPDTRHAAWFAPSCLALLATIALLLGAVLAGLLRH